MKIVRDLIRSNVGVPERLIVTVGAFDGVHLGHQRVIKEVVDWAQQLTDAGSGQTAVPGLLTFEPHPREVLNPQTVPGLLTTPERKLELIAELGIAIAFILKFDKTLAKMSAERFARDVLVKKLRIEAIVLGHDYRFGAKGAGDYDTMVELGNRHGFKVRQVEPVVVDGNTVSSTLIRTRILEGDLEGASKSLGRCYSVSGMVTKGLGLGHILGFPTANMEAQNCLIPPDGIYAVIARFNGEELPAALYIGTSPTVKETPERTIEVHIIDYRGDLYGTQIEVAFVKKLRGDTKFDDSTSLKRQIAKDIEETRRIIERVKGAA